jgi:GcrA cell cycle regulator
MPDQSWTDERVGLLKQLWTTGETAAAIGERLGGLSRSAVLGKVHRLRLNGAAATPPADKRADNTDAEIATPARRRRRTKYKKPPQPITAEERRHESLFELTNKTCRWPHGRPRTDRFFFCGAPEADLERGIPYCPEHMRRAYPTWTGGEAPTRAESRLLRRWK